eukprot:366279_1
MSKMLIVTVTALFTVTYGIGRGYIKETTALSWQAANDACNTKYGTTLATVIDDDDKAAFLEASGGSGLWVGLNDIGEEGVWQWVDGTACTNPTASTTEINGNANAKNQCIDYWSLNEPNDYEVGGTDCMYIYWSGSNLKTNDKSCSETRPYMCNVDYEQTNGYCQDACCTVPTATASEDGTCAWTMDRWTHNIVDENGNSVPNTYAAYSAWCSARVDCLGFGHHYDYDRVYLKSKLETYTDIATCKLGVGLSQGNNAPTNRCYVKITTSEPVDCVLGEWYNDGECSTLCGTGIQNQKKDIITPAENEGDCGATTQQIACNTQSCCPNGINTFNWDTMIEEHINAPSVEDLVFGVDSTDLTLNIYVELPYLGKTSADNQREAKFGTTYVIDFEDFNAHSDAINEPGTCQNRMSSSFTGKDFNDFWTYSLEPQNTNGIGNLNTLSYPPSDKWSISMKDNDCDTIIYERSFTWQELRDCSGFNGEAFTSLIHEDNKYKLSGTMYINVVSPFWYESDFGYYRVYQLLSKP